MANDVCSHVKVVVRVRPENERERRENYRNVVQVVDNHMLIFDPKQEEVSCFGAQRLRNRNVTKKANKDLKFVFDHVFNENSTQVDIFESTTKVVLDGLMNGFNCTGNNDKQVICWSLLPSHPDMLCFFSIAGWKSLQCPDEDLRQTSIIPHLSAQGSRNALE